MHAHFIVLLFWTTFSKETQEKPIYPHHEDKEGTP